VGLRRRVRRAPSHRRAQREGARARDVARLRLRQRDAGVRGRQRVTPVLAADGHGQVLAGVAVGADQQQHAAADAAGAA